MRATGSKRKGGGCALMMNSVQRQLRSPFAGGVRNRPRATVWAIGAANSTWHRAGARTRRTGMRTGARRFGYRSGLYTAARNPGTGPHRAAGNDEWAITLCAETRQYNARGEVVAGP